MTIKITRDVNLDEKAIHIENDKLTVHVSNNPNNKLVKTENGLEVLINIDSTNSPDTLITKEEVTTYIQENYPDYSEVTEEYSLYNPKTKLYNKYEKLHSIDIMKYKEINLENSSVEYTLSNYESLTPEEFANKYTNMSENTLDYLKDSLNREPIAFLVGDLVIKFKFSKDDLPKEDEIIDSLSKSAVLALSNEGWYYRELFGYESLNKDVSEDDSYWHLSLTYEKYTEIKGSDWEGSTYTISDADSYADYKEHAAQSLKNKFTYKGRSERFSLTATKEVKIDSKLNVPVKVHTTYIFS